MKGYELNQLTLHDLFAQIYLCSRPDSASNDKLREELLVFARMSGGTYRSRGKEYLKEGWIEEHKWPLRLKFWRSLLPTIPAELREGRAVYYRIDRAFKRIVSRNAEADEEHKLFAQFARPVWQNRETLESRKDLIVQESASGFSIFYLEREYLRPIKLHFQEKGTISFPTRKKIEKKPKKRGYDPDDMSGDAFLHFIGEDT